LQLRNAIKSARGSLRSTWEKRDGDLGIEQTVIYNHRA